MIRRSSILGPAVVAVLLAGSTAWWTSRDSGSQPAPTGSAVATVERSDTAPGLAGEVRMEYLGIPNGVWDPVVKVPVDTERFMPPLNRVLNDTLGDGLGTVQSEVAIWLDGDEILVGWNDSDGFGNPSVSISGWGYSADRGETWVDGGALPVTGSINPGGDPSVVRTNAGTWLLSSLDFATPVGLAIHRGVTSGGTIVWDPAIQYSLGGAFLDKEYLEYDPLLDVVYLSYLNGSAGEYHLTRSTDDGVTWETPVVVADRNSGNGAYPVVGVDGEMYVSYIEPISTTAPCTLFVRHSTNGGVSFDSPSLPVVELQPESIEPPECFNRPITPPWGSFDVDRSNGPHRGRLYGVWGEGGMNERNVVFAYSDDHGASWSLPAQLNDNLNAAETESFWPSVRVSETDGRVLVGFYDRRKEALTPSLADFYVTMSVDGGVTWGPNRRLSDTSVAWCGVPAEASPNFGDYVDVELDERSIFGVWSDARQGDPDVVLGRFDDRHLLAVDGAFDTTAAFAGGGTAWFVPNEAEYVVSTGAPTQSAAELSVSGLAMAMLATPKEVDGIFFNGGEDLSASLTLTSPTLGLMTGTFAVVRVDSVNIDLTFDVTADSAVVAADLPAWTATFELSNGGAGMVMIDGTVSFGGTVDDPQFALAGTITLNGAPGFVFQRPRTFGQSATVTEDGPDLTVHTRTTVEESIVISVPDTPSDDPQLTGTNPFPLVGVSVSPNPWRAESRVHYASNRELAGRIVIISADGRRVRTVATGPFPAGEVSFDFDGRDESGRPLGSGLYFVRLESDALSVAKKFLVLR